MLQGYPYTSIPQDSLDVNIADETYRTKIDRQSMGTLKGRFSFRIYVYRSASFERTVADGKSSSKSLLRIREVGGFPRVCAVG
jgi:hypothetical protein